MTNKGKKFNHQLKSLHQLFSITQKLMGKWEIVVASSAADEASQAKTFC